MTIFTLGHSTRSIGEFIDLLRAHGVARVIDVRTIPRSRRNPQFDRTAFSRALRARRINYRHMKDLGGLRRPDKGSTANAAWRNASFRGYADYMRTERFERALKKLAALAARKPAALVCAEAVPWRCHRSLIADALTARGVAVRHIMSRKTARPHKLSPMARARGGRVTYPAAPTRSGGLR